MIAVLVAAVAMDVATGKIRNWLTLPAVALGPVLALLEGGGQQALLSLEGIGAMLLVGVILAALGMMGGGDIKLLLAVGALGGLPLVKYALIFTGMAGGVLAIVVLVKRLGVRTLLQRVGQAFWLKVGARVSCDGVVGGGIKLPYAIPIAVGTGLALFWRPF